MTGNLIIKIIFLLIPILIVILGLLSFFGKVDGLILSDIKTYERDRYSLQRLRILGGLQYIICALALPSILFLSQRSLWMRVGIGVIVLSTIVFKVLRENWAKCS